MARMGQSFRGAGGSSMSDARWSKPPRTSRDLVVVVVVYAGTLGWALLASVRCARLV